MKRINKQYIALMLIVIIIITSLKLSETFTPAIVSAEEGDFVVPQDIEENESDGEEKAHETEGTADESEENQVTNNTSDNSLLFDGDGSGEEDSNTELVPVEFDNIENGETPKMTPYGIGGVNSTYVTTTDGGYHEYVVTEVIDTGTGDQGRLIAASGVYEIIGTYNSNANRIRIDTADVDEVVLILNNANRSASLSPITILGNSNVKIIVRDGTTNVLECNDANTSSLSAGAAILVSAHSTNATPVSFLTIESGYLKDVDPDGSNPEIPRVQGELTALAGGYSAGIGGGPNQNAGYILIKGGNITAETRSFGGGAGTANGAAIGGGGGHTSGGGSSAGIYIGGDAVVTAIGGGHGAGIGGAGGGGNAAASGISPGPGSGGIITIEGNATVMASSAEKGAGIGGGGRSPHGSTVGKLPGDGGIITIRGNAKVTATSEGQGAGIGGSGAAYNEAGSGGIITIEDNAEVVANATGRGAGIGGGGSDDNINGFGGTSGIITITGTAKVTSESGLNGAGIGGGAGPAGGGNSETITIGGDGNIATVIAKSGGFGAGIGGGGAANAVAGTGGEIRITDANVQAESVGKGAGIGGGGSIDTNAGTSGDILINGNAIVVAKSADNGAGIGGGGGAQTGGNIGSIIITGNAKVTASGDKLGAGIGGGGSSGGTAGSGGTITISGNAVLDVEARGIGAGIGGGGSSTGTAGAGGAITIKENTIVTVTTEGIGAGIGGGGGATSGSSGTIEIRELSPDKVPIIKAVSKDGHGIGPGLGASTGEIIIPSGNVFANNMDTIVVENGFGDRVYMYKVRTDANEFLSYQVNTLNSGTIYEYIAYADDAGDAYLWKPASEKEITIVDNSDEQGKIYNAAERVDIDITATYTDSFQSGGTVASMRWFRVPVADTTPYDTNNFETQYSNADGINKGYDDDVDGTYEHTFETIKADMNATYWFEVSFLNQDGTISTMYKSIKIENFYTPIKIYVRDVEMVGDNSTQVKNYTKLEIADSTQGNEVYGIPYDFGVVSAETVLDSSLKFGYDEVVYLRNDGYPADEWRLDLPELFVNMNIVLNATALAPDFVDSNPDPAPKESNFEERYYTAAYINAWPIVTKTVAGEFGDKTKLFDFWIEFTDSDENIGWKIINAENKTINDGTIAMTGGTGSLEFQLAHGYRILFSYSGESNAVKYTVLEEQLSDYTTTINGAATSNGETTGTIGEASEPRVIAYENTREDIVRTGVSFNNQATHMILIGSIIGLLVLMMFFVRKRVRHQRR